MKIFRFRKRRRHLIRRAISMLFMVSALSSCGSQNPYVVIHDATEDIEDVIPPQILQEEEQNTEQPEMGAKQPDNAVTQAEQPDVQPVADGQDIRVSFIDIGQGDSILIKDGDDTMLIDTGYYKAYGQLQPYIDEACGSDGLDVLVLTHPDADHIGSAASVIWDYGVGTLYMPPVDSDTVTFQKMMEAAQEEGVSIVNPGAGEFLNFGTALYQVLGPVQSYSDDNSNSLIIRMVNGEDSFLFTGDATGKETEDVIAAGFDVSADVYKAAHHGSANDGCNEASFVEAVNPSAAIISCGLHNQHGHPHAETMQLFKDMGISVYRTDLQGTVSCTSTGNGIVFDIGPTDDYRNGNSIPE